MRRYSKAITALVLTAAYFVTQFWPDLHVNSIVEVVLAALIPVGVYAVPNVPPGINSAEPPSNVP